MDFYRTLTPKLKVPTVAYEKWPFTRGSNYSALAGKIYIDGCLWEVVTSGGSIVVLSSPQAAH